MSGRVKSVVERAGGAVAVALGCGVHETTVYAWMRNDHVGWMALPRFCRVAGVSLMWMAGWQLGRLDRTQILEAVEVPAVAPAELPGWLSGRAMYEHGAGLIVDGRLAMPGDWIVLRGTDPDGRADVRIVGASDWAFGPTEVQDEQA